MTDFPEMTIATDSVDEEMVNYPRRWDIKAIRKFMITFGILSSLFDYLTFGALLFMLHASQVQFRTGWFVESVVSASLIVLVIRSRKPFFQEQTWQVPACCHINYRSRNASRTLHSICHTLWF